MKKNKTYDDLFTTEEKENIVNDYTENYLSIRKICEKYNIKSKLWVEKLLGKKVRSLSESAKNAHLKYPEKFKHSKETKEKIRIARLKYMKAHPEQTAWRQKNMSYPEKCFEKILKDNKLDKKHLIYREYPVFPYFIDFAFVNEKIAVEIDGSQHLELDRKLKDEKKDKLLLSNGWRVLRITAAKVIKDGTEALSEVIKMLDGHNVKSHKVGILKTPKSRQKTARGNDGLTDRQRESAFRQRKVKDRPSKETLWELVKTTSFESIGKLYGVNGNSIRKWCKGYGLPSRKKDIDIIIGKEHKRAKELHICLRCGNEYYSDKHNSKFCGIDCYRKFIAEKRNTIPN